jgi:hypothetical protein
MNKQSVPIAQAVAEPTISEANTRDNAREFLQAHMWPVGLQDTFINNLSLISKRFFICDDSGSMMANDGHKLLLTPAGVPK